MFFIRQIFLAPRLSSRSAHNLQLLYNLIYLVAQALVLSSRLPPHNVVVNLNLRVSTGSDSLLHRVLSRVLLWVHVDDLVVVPVLE